jgi:ribokinase
MRNSPQILVVGSIMQDLVFACGKFPVPGQTVVARLSTGQGGKGSNQAIACGRAGAPTMFIGATGDDEYSRRVEAYYRRAGIGCRLVRKRDSATGTAVVMLNGHGQNQIVIEPGANLRLKPADVPARLWRGAKLLLAQLECDPATTGQVLRRARQEGVTTLLNPAPMHSGIDPRLLRQVDILVPNETEFVALARLLPQTRMKRFDEAALRRLKPAALHALCRRLGVPTVIVTLGSRGCFISERAGWSRVPAYKGMRVVDTTGAGDAFCGGFAAGFVRTGKVVEAAKFGTAVAALSITKPGAAAAMPTKGEIKRFLLRHGLAT